MRKIVLAFACAWLTACASSSAAVDTPAVIVEPDANSRLALQNAVSKALGVAYVVLAEDALTKDNTLVIEPKRIRDFEGRLLQGRETRRPEVFRLIRAKGKKDCVLIYERTQARIPLPDTRCKAK